MSRQRSNAILEDSVEEYLENCIEPETEENDEAELEFAERTGSIELREFALSCCSSSATQYNSCIKILLLGAKGSGKSSFLRKFLGQSWSNDSPSTNGVEISTTYIHMGGQILKL
jgi:DNA replication protein DnaC